LEFAADLLENVNAHKEAAELRAKAQKSLQVVGGQCVGDDELAEENALLAAQRN
jgi:CO dehydrogenase/acetyl-CoA synthase epsilon subunit